MLYKVLMTAEVKVLGWLVVDCDSEEKAVEMATARAEGMGLVGMITTPKDVGVAGVAVFKRDEWKPLD